MKWIKNFIAWLTTPYANDGACWICIHNPADPNNPDELCAHCASTE